MTSSSENRRIEQHITVCDECRDALRWMQTTRRILSERPRAMPPADMRLRIARAIASSSSSAVPRFSVHRRFVLRPAVWAVAASLAIAGIIDESVIKPQAPAHPVSTPVIAGSGHNSASPHLQPAPVKQLAHDIPSHVKRLAHSATPLLVATQHFPSPVTGYVPKPASHSNSGDTIRVANAAPSSPVRLIPPAVKPIARVRQPMLANKNGDTTPIVKFAPIPKPVVEAVIPAPAPVTPPSVIVTPAPPDIVHEASSDTPEPAPSRPVHADLLSSVKLKVASINEGSVSKKVYRDINARVQVAAYDVGNDTGKFVQQPITYTDGLYPKQ